MSFSMHLLFGISLMIVFGTDEVRSVYTLADAGTLKTNFGQFVRTLQDLFLDPAVSYTLRNQLDNYDNQIQVSDLNTLAVFKEITYHLLDSTLFPIALPLLKKSAVAVENAITKLCTAINKSVSNDLKYANLPLRNQLQELYFKSKTLKLLPGSRDSDLPDGGITSAEAMAKFNTMCPLSAR